MTAAPTNEIAIGMKISDLAICATPQPIAAAASSEVRVEAGNSRTWKAKPAPWIAAWTRRALSFNWISLISDDR